MSDLIEIPLSETEAKYFDLIFSNDANKQELIEKVPSVGDKSHSSLDIKWGEGPEKTKGVIKIKADELDGLVDFVDESARLDGRDAPNTFKSNSFYKKAQKAVDTAAKEAFSRTKPYLDDAAKAVMKVPGARQAGMATMPFMAALSAPLAAVEGAGMINMANDYFAPTPEQHAQAQAQYQRAQLQAQQASMPVGGMFQPPSLPQGGFF